LSAVHHCLMASSTVVASCRSVVNGKTCVVRCQQPTTWTIPVELTR